MKISVVMGIYNCQDTLGESLESLLNQSFQDFEIILCDDGSTDRTFQVAKNYMMQYPFKIRLLRNSFNRGLAFSLNKCIQAAYGEYIARMDADDLAHPDRFKKQLEFLEQHSEYDFVGSSASLFDETGTWGERKMKEKPDKKDFLFVSPFIHPTLMIRRQVIEMVSLYDTSKRTLRAEDYDLFMRLYAAEYKGYNLQESLLQFREDAEAVKRRVYKYRFDEMRVRYTGFKNLQLLPQGYPYIVKPLIVGLIPHSILKVLKEYQKVEGLPKRKPEIL